MVSLARLGGPATTRLALALLFVGVCVVVPRAAAADPWIGQEQARVTFDTLVDLFRREYWDPGYVDWDAWADEHRDAVLGARDRRAFDRALTRMVRALADGHSSWTGLPGVVPPGVDTEADPGLPADATPRLGVQYAFISGRGLVVERVFPETPAAEAGLQRGDVIATVEGAPLAGLRSFTEANALLLDALERGRFTLGVERRRSTFDVDVVPAPVAFAEVATRPYGWMLDATTGYLAVPTFNVGGVGERAHQVLGELVEAGAVALVLDLRGNLGGRLVELGLLLGAFTDGVWAEGLVRGEVGWEARFDREGTRGVARLVEPGGVVLAEAAVPVAVRWRGPIVALVGSENASAGEIAALALQDLGLARVVGEATIGNVEAVRGFALPDGSRVLIAVANLRGVHGLDFDAGVVPEVVVRTEQADLARGVDTVVAEARRLLGALPFRPDRYF